MHTRLLALVVLVLASRSAWALDSFERHTSYWLKQVPKKAEPVGELTQKAAVKLKLLGPKVPAPCVAIQTASGNWTKAQLGWGFRRSAGKLTPIVVIERFVTYDGLRGDQTLAWGEDVMLFPGFSFDFDIGQVVPQGQGEDLTFLPNKSLRVQGETKLYPLDGPAVPAQDASENNRPANHEGVLPADFSGTWAIDADGRFAGTLILDVQEEGMVFGRYVSDKTRSVYPAKGRISRPPHRLVFSVEFVGAPQNFDGYLWTSDKSTMAGTVTVGSQKFGFVARRKTPAEDKSEPKKKPSADGE